MNGAWLILAASAIADVAGSMLIKQLDGFHRPFMLLGVLSCFLVAMGLFTYSMTQLPLGPAFAIWSGAGMLLVALLAIVLYGQVPDFAAGLGMSLILIGVVIISLFSKMEVH